MMITTSTIYIIHKMYIFPSSNCFPTMNHTNIASYNKTTPILVSLKNSLQWPLTESWERRGRSRLLMATTWLSPQSGPEVGVRQNKCQASVLLIMPWLLPGLTAREWEERGWVRNIQSSRKFPNAEANTGQVIWRLGCIKAIYKRQRDLWCFCTVCSFIWPGTRWSCFLTYSIIISTQ